MVAATLGVMLGVVLTFVSHRAVTFVTPDDPFRGVAIVGLMMGARFVLALMALAGYYFVARVGLVVFGATLVLAFLVGLVVETMKMSRTPVSRTSA